MADPEAVIKCGAPALMWIRYTARPSGDTNSGINTCCSLDNVKLLTSFYELLTEIFKRFDDKFFEYHLFD